MIEKLNITKIDPDVLIELLEKMGLNGNIENMLVEDVEEGFELNEDGTFNIIKYVAWLIINSRKK